MVLTSFFAAVSLWYEGCGYLRLFLVGRLLGMLLACNQEKVSD